MARQLRIEYPGAFYHVTSRGNQKQPVFLSSWDRARFLDYLDEAHEKLDALVHSYCLMESHYHLMLETRQANLSKIMHFMNTSFTIYLNKRHKRVGHLFQGRFKAILIEAETYAQELSRYIHLNPLRAGIVKRPEDHAWSSLREYLGQRKPPRWLDTSFVLGLFGDDPDDARLQYAAFISSLLIPTVPNPFKNKNGGSPAILGSKGFLERIKETYLQGKAPNREFPLLRQYREKPPLGRIRSEVVRRLGNEDKLSRNMAIFLTHGHTDYRLEEIGDYFGISQAAIGMVCLRIKQVLSQNPDLSRAVEEIKRNLFNRTKSGSNLQS
jgi:REP element-mobilizing transposase RayT